MYTYLASLDKGFRDFSIAPTVARCDQIGNAATFKEGRQFTTRKKHVDEFDHFHKA